VDAAQSRHRQPAVEDNSIQGAQGILINISGSSSLTLHEVHEASSVIQKAAHENANIIFGAVQDDAMKDTIKNHGDRRGLQGRQQKAHPSEAVLPAKTWKAGPEVQEVQIAKQVQDEPPPPAAVTGSGRASRSGAAAVREVHQDMDDLDVRRSCVGKRKKPDRSQHSASFLISKRGVIALLFSLHQTPEIYSGLMSRAI